MDFYQEKITTTKEHIKNKDYAKAYDILLKELSMPYIPKKYKAELASLFETVNRKIYQIRNKKHTASSISFKNIKEALKKDSQYNFYDQMILFQQIKLINPLPLIKEINAFLQSEKENYLLKTILIGSLSKTQYHKVIKVVKFNKIYEIDLNSDIEVIDANLYNSIYLSLEKKYLMVAPNLLEHCKNIIEILLLNLYPEKIDFSAWKVIACAVGYYIDNIYHITTMPLKDYALENGFNIEILETWYKRLIEALNSQK